MCIYIYIYIYTYDPCAWTPNNISKTALLGGSLMWHCNGNHCANQLRSLCNRYLVSGYLLRIQVCGKLRLPEAT